MTRVKLARLARLLRGTVRIEIVTPQGGMIAARVLARPPRDRPEIDDAVIRARGEIEELTRISPDEGRVRLRL